MLWVSVANGLPLARGHPLGPTDARWLFEAHRLIEPVTRESRTPAFTSPELSSLLCVLNRYSCEKRK